MSAAVHEVAPAYHHAEKWIAPSAGIDLAGARLKWYDIAPAGEPVPAEIRELARHGLADAADAGTLDFAGQLGFVILHRCGESFYFLIVCTWRGNNEVWETVWAKDGAADPGFRPWPAQGTHRPTFCVWELGAVWAEQQAWTRYLRTERDAAAVEAYLADVHEGPV